MATQSHDERERETIKASLKTWWSNFTKSGKLGGGGGGGGGGSSSSNAGAAGGSTSGAATTTGSHDKVFGEPLRRSLKYASVAISMAGEDGRQYVWGYVPIIVAKTGLFLKENATEVEGVFRIAGSQKRMRELQEVFDTPPKYGKHLTWERYSVHDGASVLRRYLNQMPEPIVPLHLYNEFRNVMIRQPVDLDAAIKTYRLLVTAMPPANRYLLLYVLDLLAVFARNSDANRMPASNLAVIFQPGIFSHPSHLQDANEHKVAVEVLQFLIENQDHFVLAISPPPATNIGPSELTSVSRPAEENAPDVAELSDSDEEFGVLTVHEGGGAKLARRSTTNEGRSKRRGFFRSRKSATPSPAPPPAELSPQAEDAGEGVLEDLGEGKVREPASPQGEIHEVGITSEAANKPRSPITTVGIRRSKTVPSRRAKDREEARSVSAGKPKAPAGHEAEGMTTEASAAPLTPLGEAQAAAKDDDAVKPTVIAPPDLPTPPPSKHLENPAAKTATAVEAEAANP